VQQRQQDIHGAAAKIHRVAIAGQFPPALVQNEFAEAETRNVVQRVNRRLLPLRVSSPLNSREGYRALSAKLIKRKENPFLKKEAKNFVNLCPADGRARRSEIRHARRQMFSNCIANW
jgi:hypothetical protein